MSKTKIRAALMLFISGCAASCCLATPLPSGGTVVPGTGLETGTLLASITRNFTEPTYTGTLTESVYRETGGTLDFDTQFFNTLSSNDILVRLIDTSFGKFTTDVSYDLMAPGEIAPNKATRDSSNGGEVLFYFPDALGIHPGQTSALVIIQTDATAYSAGNSSVKDHYTATVTTFEPIIPEPASLALLGCSGLSLLLRRRHSPMILRSLRP